ncbi:MAG: ankyrin repeat domain-containing protein, partial [Rickettsiales bacterium]|nr:ankyrin repeat domain-containing protein [Rickettsiales bacterium]
MSKQQGSKAFKRVGQDVVGKVKSRLATTKLFEGIKRGEGWGLPANAAYSDAFQAAQDIMPQNRSIGGAHTNFFDNTTAAIGMGEGGTPTTNFHKMPSPGADPIGVIALALVVRHCAYEASKVAAKGRHGAYKYFNPDPKKLSKEEKKALKKVKEERKEWFETVGHPTKMKEFLEKHPNFDVNIPNDVGKSAAHILAENLKPTSMKLLMDHGARINALDMDGNTPLHYAVRSDNKRAVEDLVKRGANINVANPKTGKTPIDVSHDVRNQLPDALDITAERSEVTALLDDTEKAGQSLIAAAKQGDEKKLDKLLDASPHLINYQNEKGETPIFAATQSNKMEAASFLTEKGANFAIENNDGIHAGNLAAQRVEDIVLNVRDEADLSRALKAMPKEMRAFSLAARDEEGNQIIHVAAANKSNQEVLKVLVDNGASLTSENNAKDKALEIATDVNAKELTLDSYGGFDNPPSPEMEYLKEATVREEAILRKEANLALFNKKSRQKEQEPESKSPIRAIKEEGDKANTAGVEQEHKEFMTKRAFDELPLNDAIDVGRAKKRIAKDMKESRAKKAFAELPLNYAIDVDRAKERIESDSKEMKEFYENVLDDSNIEKVKQALKANPLLAYAVDKDGGTALHFAAANGAEKVAEALIEAGADVNAQDKKLVTPLHDAVFENREKVVSSLMEHGANLSVEDDEGRTAAYYAVLDNKSNDLVKHFAKSPGDRNGHTPFHYAASEGKYEAVQALLDAGADVDATDNQGKTMLHHAVMEDKPWLIKYLLEQGASVHIVDRNDMTPEDLAISTDRVYEGEKSHLVAVLKDYREAGDALVAAATKGDEAAVKKMLKEAPYLVNYRNNNDDTPLHAAASKGHKEVAELLVAKGANTAIANDQGKTAMDVAYGKANGWLKEELGFKNGGKEVGDTLADMNPHKLEQIQGRVDKRQEAIDTLERLGKRVMAKRDNARAGRALMDAAANGEVDKVKEILEKRPNLVYGENLEGNTALHVAAENGHTEVLKLLVEKGARVSAENKEGKTALQVIQAQDESLWRHFSNQLNPGLYEEQTEAKEFLEAEQQKLDDLIKGLTPQKDVHLAIKDATPEQKAEMAREQEEKDAEFVRNERRDPFGHKNRAMQELKDKKEAVAKIEKFAQANQAKAEEKHARENLVRLASSVSPSVNDIRHLDVILQEHPKLLNTPLNENGETVLHIAAENGHSELSKALVARGANVLQKNDYDLHAYDLAQERADKKWVGKDQKAEEVMDILRSAMTQEKRRLAEEVLAKEAAIEAEQQKAELTANIMNDLAMSDSLSRINEDRTREDISTRDLKNL